jgi:hypothetical protein
MEICAPVKRFDAAAVEDVSMLTIYMPQGASFQLINTLVAQLEGADGPLTGLAIERKATVLLFDETAPKPAVFAKLQPASDAAPPGAALVCNGTVIVAGALTACSVYRSAH